MMIGGMYQQAAAWLRGRGRGAKSPPRVPDGCRVYAVGDIHGSQNLLLDLLDQINADAALHTGVERKLLVFLGDYVDRGAASKAVVDRLITLPAQWPDVVFLRGNHEQAMLDFLDAAPGCRAWLNFGGLETLASYGVDTEFVCQDETALTAIRSALRQAMPRLHLDFMRGLGFSIALGDYFFAHAGIKPGIPLNAQSPDDLMWIREPFLSSRRDHGKVIVHGHSIKRAPEFRANRIGIDTGAWASGCLTCLVLEGTEQRLITTEGHAGVRHLHH